MAGVLEDQAVVACLSGNGRYIRSFPLDSGPSLVPLLWRGEYLDNVGYWVAHGPGKTPEGNPAYVYNYHNFAPFLLLNAPEEASSVEITVRLEGEECPGGGWQLKDGIWLLGIEREQRLGKWATGGTAYILRLFRADRTTFRLTSGVTTTDLVTPAASRKVCMALVFTSASSRPSTTRMAFSAALADRADLRARRFTFLLRV